MQVEFNSTIKLLSSFSEKVPFALELLSICFQSEHSYHETFNGQKEPNRKYLLSLYSLRGSYEKKADRINNPFVLEYDFLLPRIESSEAEVIMILSVTCDGGSYMIFADPDKAEIFGILKSKRTLSEIRDKGIADGPIFINGFLKA